MFVVEFGGCGGRFGLLLGGLERWMSGGSLGGVWEGAAGCGEGNCLVGCVGLQVEVRWCFRVV